MRREISPTFNPVVYGSISDLIADLTPEMTTADIRIEGGVSLLLRWENRGYSTTVVSFGAALGSKGAKNVPVFSGKRLFSGLKTNVLYVSDPSVEYEKSLTLGWYLGCAERPECVQELDAVFQAFAKFQRLIFFGVSGGGFASLLYSAKVPDSLAVASNPQTDIDRYFYASKYRNLAWGNENVDVLSEVISVYSQRTENHVLYLQNVNDLTHMSNHLSHFISALNPHNTVVVKTLDLEDGHVGLQSGEYRTMFKKVLREQNNLAALQVIADSKVKSNVLIHFLSVKVLDIARLLKNKTREKISRGRKLLQLGSNQ